MEVYLSNLPYKSMVFLSKSATVQNGYSDFFCREIMSYLGENPRHFPFGNLFKIKNTIDNLDHEKVQVGKICQLN